MRLFVTVLLLLTVACGSIAQTKYRRGNPTTGQQRSEFYIIDSDDDSPLKPTYRFVDTTYGAWTRITTWSNTDDGYAYVPRSVTRDTMQYYFAYRSLLVDTVTVVPPSPAPSFVAPGASISTNGTIDLLAAYPSYTYTSPNNVPLPDANIPHDLIAPLWSDWELRTAGDTSKVFVRSTADSFYVTYYNLGLKGTNGNIRATFQAVFSPKDTSITFDYKSFDGVWNGVPAAQLIQNNVTIGISSGAQSYNNGVTYLHKGYYSATNPNPQYQASLHNGLAIRFKLQSRDAFQIVSITNPPYDHYELSSILLTPQASIQNIADTNITIYIRTTFINLATGVTYYNRSDSMVAAHNTTSNYIGPAFSGVPCGTSKMTMTLSYPNGTSDQWAGNNTAVRYFNAPGTLVAPYRDEFNTLPMACNWVNSGVQPVDAVATMYVPDAGIVNGPKALVFNRYDGTGQPYPGVVAGDTLTTAPIDLTGQSNVYVYFHYQRGLKSDSSQAGIFNRLLSGPERQVGAVQLGDTLFVEGITNAQSALNPVTWAKLGAIPGGFDFTTQTFRMLLPAAYVHNHSRIRIRLAAQNHAGPRNWFDDSDNFVVDQFHVEPLQANATELEPMDITLGNGIYNRIPRNLPQGITPVVRIMNNGDGVSLGLNVLNVSIRDALNRLVYDRTVPFSFPQPRADSLIPMPAWDIRGSQGGVFTARVSLDQTFYESYRSNDTNVFYKTLYIGDNYGIDDGQPDTVGTSTTPLTDFSYILTPLGTDSLRGVDFYFSGPINSTWSLNIKSGALTFNRSLAYAPTSAGFVRSTFLPVPTTAGVPDTLHFVMSTGSKLGGDAQYGLVYPSTSGTGTSVLHPEILSNFFYGNMGSPFTSPTSADSAQGGILLPMMRLVYSGSQTFLPVKLISLGAERLADGAVRVHWQGAAEQNLANYELRRESDGQTVAHVAPTFLSKNDYSTLDRSAPTSEVQYELLEQDLDGSRQSLGHVTAGAVAVGALEVRSWPNPAVGQITLNSNKLIESVRVIDPTGRVIREDVANAFEFKLLTSSLASGMYLVEIHTGAEISRIPISIIK